MNVSTGLAYAQPKLSLAFEFSVNLNWILVSKSIYSVLFILFLGFNVIPFFFIHVIRKSIKLMMVQVKTKEDELRCDKMDQSE